ncbi:MAG: DUF6531 domain-containing protein [Bacteroidota bacterium]|nr:DUF6531 domain-containing protein [Bacteroidota bacterium]
MEKKYVPSGVCLVCDKGTLPSMLTVTSNLTTEIYGVQLATEADKLPMVNIPPMGVCAVTHIPCIVQPSPLGWSPVQNSVIIGGQRLLLEDSKLRCLAGGQVSLLFVAPPAPPTPPGLLDAIDAKLAELGPAGDPLRFQMGVAEGVVGGVVSLAEGLWSLGKLAVKAQVSYMHALAHPVDTAQSAWKGATAAADWASKGENWNHAWDASQEALGKADQAMSDAHDWVADGGIQKWASQQSPRDWGKLGGRGAFEVAMLVGTGGAGEAANAMGKAGEAANLAEKGLEAVNLAEKGGELANAAGKLELSGPVVTGAEEAADAARAAKAAEEAAAAEKAEAVAGCAERGKCTEVGHPVDVSNGMVFTQQTDFYLPGPLPLVWERTWYSRSRRQGPLGHGWHHRYDLALMVEPDGRLALRLADGRLALFEALELGGKSFNRREQLEAEQTAAGRYRVWNLRERVWYVFAPHPAQANQVLTSVEDTNGFSIRLTYDDAGHLQTITDSTLRRLDFSSGPDGQLVAIAGPDPVVVDGRVTLVQYQYDEIGNLAAAIDALGNVINFRYKGHLLVQETNRVGLSFYFTYDGTDHTARCRRTWGDGGINNTRLRYDSPEQTTVINSLGHVTTHTHQEGLVISTLDANGALWQWVYNAFGHLEIKRDPLGYNTLYDHDARGNVTQTTYQDGTQIQTQYNEHDLPVEVIDANSNAWKWQYDPAGNLLKKIDPTGTTTQYVYEQGLMALTVDPSGNRTRVLYDASCQPAKIITTDGQASSRTYDTLGRVTHLRDTRGKVQRRHYDLLGRLTSLHNPDGTERHFRYDGEGNVVEVQEQNEQISFAYSGLNRVISRRQQGRDIHFQYDSEGQFTGLRNEAGQQYAFGLDAVGNVVSETGFDGITRNYQRNLAGQIVEVHRPDDRFTQYVYDACGRLQEIRYDDGTGQFFTYRADGELLEARNEHGVVSFQKDPLGRAISESQNGFSITSAYNIIGQRSGFTSSLGAAVTIKREWSGNVSQIQADSWQASFEYDASGLETQRRTSNRTTTSWYHDALDHLTQQRLAVEGRLTHFQRYEWNNARQLTVVDDAAHGTIQFAYDSLGALAATRYADGTTEYRRPDELGNLFKSEERTDRRYDVGGRLLEAGGITYKYDAEGRLIRKQLADGSAWTYTWTPNGMLSSVVRPEGGVVSFTYDPLGRRISKRFQGRVTRWVWDGDKPLHEWQEADANQGSTADVITWLFEENSFAPLAKLTSQQAYSVVTDYLGTPLQLINQSGQTTWSAGLNTYGAVRQGSGNASDCPFRYPGQYEDVETGLYYNRFRYYDPLAGTYISQDPIGLHGNNLNLYAYVANVTGNVDVFGLYPMWDPVSKRWRDSVTGLFRTRPTELMKTQSGEAFFWSGRTPRPDGTFGGGATAAEGIARAEGGTTLEMLFEKHEIKMPVWDDTNPVHTREWGKLSEAYAQGASGRVRGVIGQGLRPGNIWEGYEKGALIKNPNVTQIETIDPVTGKREIIYRKGC